MARHSMRHLRYQHLTVPLNHATNASFIAVNCLTPLSEGKTRTVPPPGPSDRSEPELVPGSGWSSKARSLVEKGPREVEQPLVAYLICTTDQGPSSGLSTSLGRLTILGNIELSHTSLLQQVSSRRLGPYRSQLVTCWRMLVEVSPSGCMCVCVCSFPSGVSQFGPVDGWMGWTSGIPHWRH